MVMQFQFNLLGPVQAEWDGRPVDLGPPQRRAVLALLLLARHQAVTVATLRTRLWGGSPPKSATAAIQVHVHGLRRVLAAAASQANVPELVTHPGQPSDQVSYELRVLPEAVDAIRFERLVDRAEAARVHGDAPGAVELYDAAMELWRGDPLANLPQSRYVQGARASLAELRLNAGKRRASILIESGGAVRALPLLRELHAEHPQDEEVVVLLAEAMCGIGARARAASLLTDELERWERDYQIRPAALLRQRAGIMGGTGGDYGG